MPLLSARFLVPITLVVLAWAGIHLLGTRNVAVTPAVWPIASASPSGAAGAPVLPSTPSPAPSQSPSGGGGVPILPGALQQLNGSTRDTAVGVYALIRQLEEALRAHLQELVKQLEPGG